MSQLLVRHADHKDGRGQIMPIYGWIMIELPSRDFYLPEEDTYNRHAREVRVSVDDSWGLMGLTELGHRIFNVGVLRSIDLFEVWTGGHFADHTSCFRLRWQARRPEDVSKPKIRAIWNSTLRVALAGYGQVDVGDLMEPIS